MDNRGLRGRTFARAMLAAGAVAACGFAAEPAGAAQGGTPDLSGVYARGLYMKPPPGVAEEVILPTNGVIPGMFGPGPITPLTGIDDPAKQYLLGDYRSPLLKPRAAAAVKAHNDAAEMGTAPKPNDRPCAPSGLFMELTNPGLVKVTQTPSEITFEFQSDGERRVIHMNAQHPAAVTPSPSGHSIGRWEGGTLVVDTVGIDNKAALDRYGTPHSPALHVVERISLIKNGRALEDHVYAEDPPVFYAPWWGVVTLKRAGAWTAACPAR